ncbi:hypothetical protein FB451DRAFT_1208283 [Mycena latifolia]|nr:hypothetical protein FB451DRAFT_1208283 [Mycena latifolia]
MEYVLKFCGYRPSRHHVRIEDGDPGPHQYTGIQTPARGILRNCGPPSNTPRPASNYGATEYTYSGRLQPSPARHKQRPNQNKPLPDLPQAPRPLRRHKRVPSPSTSAPAPPEAPQTQSTSPFLAPIARVNFPEGPGPRLAPPPQDALQTKSMSPFRSPVTSPRVNLLDEAGPRRSPLPPPAGFPSYWADPALRQSDPPPARRHSRSRSRSPGVRFASPHDTEPSRSPTRALQSPKKTQRSPSRKLVPSTHSQDPHPNECMLCDVCPQHQPLLSALLSPPACACNSGSASATMLCIHSPQPKLTTLPYTPAELMCISGFEPWMNSRVYVQRPFH